MKDGTAVALILGVVLVVLALLGDYPVDALAWNVVQFVLLLIVVVSFGVAFLIWSSGR